MSNAQLNSGHRMLNEESDAEGRERASTRSFFDILERKANGAKYSLDLN